MDERLLIRFIEGSLSQKERRLVLTWISESEENRQKYIETKNLISTFLAPNDRASIEDLKKFKKYSESKHKYFSKGRSYKMWGVAASILLLLAISLNIIQYRQSVTSGNEALLSLLPDSHDQSIVSVVEIPEIKESAEIQHQTFYTDKGVKGVITLPDGSVVKVNSDTRITYPERFSGKYREVEISGEGLFEVEKMSDFPMLVKTNKGLNIEVTGTKFLIRSYDNDDNALAMLLSGSINLITSGNSNEKVSVKELNPMEAAIITDNKVNILSGADTTKSLAWLQGRLIFENTPMNEVLKQLNRWHGSEFIINDRSILSYSITAQFKSESIVQIMEVLKFCSPVDYKIIEDKIYLNKR